MTKLETARELVRIRLEIAKVMDRGSSTVRRCLRVLETLGLVAPPADLARMRSCGARLLSAPRT